MPYKAIPGLYEEIITEIFDQTLSREDVAYLVKRDDIHKEDTPYLLARYIYNESLSALQQLSLKPEAQLNLVNELLETISKSVGDSTQERIPYPPEALYAIGNPHPQKAKEAIFPERPNISLLSNDLLVNAKREPSMGQTLKKEIQSADRIDLLCAFIQWNGVRILNDALAEHLKQGKQLRVLTTTYMGATQRKALDHLYNMGAEIRICYEEKSTRLHAKAWLLYRNSGYSTAFIGSSNLSHSALSDGIEWNVRLSQHESPAVLNKFHATFDNYWADLHFEDYNPERDSEKLDRALNSRQSTSDSDILLVDLNPYPHQEEILERLVTERERHGRYKNLIVAATGTGKTMIAAFDFARWFRQNPNASLLFVAHRKEILEQSLKTFRAVLRDGSFGELCVDSFEPQEWKHVFASVQSLTSRGVQSFQPNAYDFIIVDECHHSEASTYSVLLEHFESQILVGLTATPERADGQSILHWFDGRMAAEIRLWDALERQLLVPFQYFGIHDNTDLSTISWSGGKYSISELENLYTGDHARVGLIVKNLIDKVEDVQTMRALGFCVNITHAEFMAQQFNQSGVSSIALTSNTDKETRKRAKQDLISGKVNCIFTVDLFNEGVDIPDIDTVLFLRPTESMTVFLQQLGRGLRHAPNKACLTVLDYIGHAHKKFKFHDRFRAMTGATRKETEVQIENDFPYLPSGCSIELDRVAKDIVLTNIKQTLGSNLKSVVEELRDVGRQKPTITLAEFGAYAGLEPEDLYRTQNWYWTRLRRQAGLPTLPEGPNDAEFGSRLHRILHIDAADRLIFYRQLLHCTKTPQSVTLNETEKRYLLMLHFALWGDSAKTHRRFKNHQQILDNIWAHPAMKQELYELLCWLDDRAQHITYSMEAAPHWPHDVPLSVHSRYDLSEIRSAFDLLNFEQKIPIREGVRYLKNFKADLFFITLNKTEDHYSPQTMYRDYAISSTLFHWESQWNTSENSPTGQRYINHQYKGSQVFLFVRQHKKIKGQSQPYTFLGPAQYVRHEGERPMAIVWRLERPMPGDLFLESKVVTG